MAMSGSKSNSSASSRPSDTKQRTGGGDSKSGKAKRSRGTDDEDGWGGFGNYMAAKKQKLNDQFHSDKQVNQSNIFEGVRIYVNGYTKPSSDELRRIMQKHGGRYEMYLSKSRVTHIVATNLPNSKLHQAKTMPVVRPEWITESVSAGRRLPQMDYLLFGKQSKLQPGITFQPSMASMSRSSSVASSHCEESSFTQIKDRPSLSKEECTLQDNEGGESMHEEKYQEKSKKTELKGTLKNISVESHMQQRDQYLDNKMGGDKIRELHDSIKLKSFIEGNKGSLREACKNIEDRYADSKKDSSEEACKNIEGTCNNSIEDSSKGAYKNVTERCVENKNSPIKDACRKMYSKTGEEDVLSSSDDSDIILDSEDETISCVKVNKHSFPARSLCKSQRDYDPHSFGNHIKDVDKAEKRLSYTIDVNASLTSVNQVSNGEYHPCGSSKSNKGQIGKSQEETVVAHRTKKYEKEERDVILSKGSEEAYRSDQQDLQNGTRPKSLHSSTSPLRPVPSSTTSMAKAGDKQFLSEFYSNSRLHHLSTWGAEFKAYVAEIQRNKGGNFPGRERLRQAHVENVNRLGMPETLETTRHSPQERTIMHIDMDCFFVSVGLLSRPDLRGKPVAVTHSRGQGAKPGPATDAAWENIEWQRKHDERLKTHTGGGRGLEPVGTDYDWLVSEGSIGRQTFHSMAEIASCSYEARRQGVKNGMFMGKAKSLCPHLQTIPYNFTDYNRISKILYDTVASFTHDIEAVSCDEMLVDCTDLLADTGATAMEFASLLRSDMVDKTGCTASTGIGPNILLARLATRKAKPNGQFQVLRCDAKNFVKDQNVSDLPGVGYSMTRKLSKLGVTTCGDLQAIAVGRLRSEFGPKTGESLHQFSLGQDDREVRQDKQRKSVSAEVNYGIRFTKESEAVTFLQELSNEVHQRLVKLNFKGHVITLKLMVRRPDAPRETVKFMGHGICNTINKSTNLPVATNDGGLIGREVVAMYKSHNVSAADIRGIGIQMQKLEPENYKGFGGKHLHEHQSILNFAVAGKEKAPMSKTPTKSTNRETSVEDEKVLHTSMMSKSCSLIESARQEEASNSVDGSVPNTRLSCDASDFQKRGPSVEERTPAEGLPTDQIDLNTLTDVSFLLSPSQVNIDVLNELPEEISNEIRADMKEQRRRRGIHSSRSSNSHSVVDDQPGPSHTSSDVLITAVSKNTRDRCKMPSLSQVDADVLKELPEEVANEIKKEMEQHRKKNKRARSPTSSDCMENQSSASRQSQHVSRLRSENGDSITGLPSLSQVDIGCLQALPKDMQMEIQAAYTNQQQRKDELEDIRSLVGTALGQLKSPTKNKRGKQNKAGKRRGRPPVKKRLNFSSKVKGRSLDGNPETTRITDIIIIDDPEPSHEKKENPDHQTVSSVKSQGPESTSIGNALAHTPVVPFCGAQTVSDVRCLLKEWLKSSPDPGEDDIIMVTDYLISLIKANLLEQAYCHLRFLIRRVNSASLRSWQECVESIASYVQSCVCHLYGSDLKLYV